MPGGLSLRRGLKPRVLSWTLAILVALALPAGMAFLWIVDSTTVKLGTLFAEKQILFDRYRGLESLMREVSLAETVARSPAILDWAADETDPEKAKRGLAELEHYRQSFKDRSYFVVIDGSGNYYFNDADNRYETERLRYTLSRSNPRDGWYYKTVALGSGCHLNVDNDDNLGVTKVWMNCVIRSGDKVLGIIGSGLDLSRFIREVVDIPQTGVQSIFVDRSGAVQAHRDPRLVDFQSLTKDIKAKKTIFNLIDRDEDRRRLAQIMSDVTKGEVLVRSEFMSVGGRSMLVGVGYLDKLGWFNVTLMDIGEIIDRRIFLPIAALLGILLLAAAALMTLLFKRSVLDRLARVETALEDSENGRFGELRPDQGDDEIGRLSRAFARMAAAVDDNTGRLEQMVRERTEELARLAYIDPLSGALNRRGFEQVFANEQVRSRSTKARLGLAVVDLDGFKAINDTHGHQAGDEVIRSLVARLASHLGKSAVVARWGGDEFIILLRDTSTASLATTAAGLAGLIRTAPLPTGAGAALTITASIGACMVEVAETLGQSASRADRALYRAKTAGRDGFALDEGDLAPGWRPLRG